MNQGEDRWLTLLLIKSGFAAFALPIQLTRFEFRWSFAYCATAVAYTHCPSTFDGFFRQRRRWIISTLVNMVDMLQCSFSIARSNPSTSLAFLIYVGYGITVSFPLLHANTIISACLFVAELEHCRCSSWWWFELWSGPILSDCLGNFARYSGAVLDHLHGVQNRPEIRQRFQQEAETVDPDCRCGASLRRLCLLDCSCDHWNCCTNLRGHRFSNGDFLLHPRIYCVHFCSCAR
jgi:hypothetical protein